jgi:hypothetical protein
MGKIKDKEWQSGQDLNSAENVKGKTEAGFLLRE